MNRSLTKRTAMLDAGIAELVEAGLAGASMESIAARAEVSKRTLYKHFPSKDAVFEAVFALLIERVDPLGKLHYDAKRDFATQLREIAKKEMQLICDPGFVRLSRVMMIECMRSEQRSLQLMVQFGEKENGLFRWFSEAGKAGKLGKLDPRVAAELFVAMLKSPAYWYSVIGWQPSPRKAAQKRIIDEACTTLLSRLASPTRR
ncbi:TetR/AcrR family transcriptional regulator [Rhodanobacter sp. L36]|uniref:TetR/AcrR family transcriptional regulator n=1 Tax=Rhodanobacter sp. L36 TaxID=1747221 RepID=UPI00131ABAD0|nr:TetR/AcrR family transcriptional regulator [Rhodanobacter sp. L36]